MSHFPFQLHTPANYILEKESGRKLLKHCQAYHAFGNINAEKGKTVNQKRASREEKETQGKAKQNTDFLSPKNELC
jgi:hypothetical protein